MKILFLSKMFHPHTGGVEKHVLEVSKLLIQSKHDVTIVTEQYEKKLKKKELYKGIKIYRIPIPSSEKLKKFYIWWFFIKNLKLLTSADVIHAHDVYYYILPFRILLNLKNTFVTFHGYETLFPISKKSISQKKTFNLLAKKSISVGQCTQKWHKIKTNYTITGGISKTFLDSSKNVTKGKKPHILFLGRLETDNGIEKVVRALQEVMRIKKLNVSFFGSGSKKYLAQSIGTVYDSYDEKMLKSMLSCSDVVFASSYLSILEALSQRKTIISTYEDEFKKDSLFLSPFKKYIYISGDTRSTKKALTDVLTNKSSKHSLLSEGQKWARSQTWKKVSSTYLKAWDTQDSKYLS